METKIKEWIRLAHKISRYLLYQKTGQPDEEIINWKYDRLRAKKMLKELNEPDYYERQAKKREALSQKYDWNEFVRSQKQKSHHRRIRRLRYAAAVIVLLAAGSLALFLRQEPQVAVVETLASIQPGSSKAFLVLANGQEVALENQLTLTEDDGTIIRNDEIGELAYQSSGQRDNSIQYNTLRIPRGGEYRLVLADGTKVWLNSESELVYPTQFMGPKREVTLKGEAYFEIAHNQNQPFYVHSGDLQVHATGTAFDVMAYEDEPEIKVILTEGGVNIEKGSEVLGQLSPDFQFTLDKKDQTFSIQQVDPRTATAWKNGSFFFDDEPLSSIIRKLSRWYNIDIQCSQPEICQYKFSGEIRKYENASKVLDMLKLTNEITYVIGTDQQIIIYPIE